MYPQTQEKGFESCVGRTPSSGSEPSPVCISVSVALSSVQEDVDSPRVVRMVETDRRPPPAVSEEDLSVASLLDIPSWADPAGHSHSESVHGDLLDELEIPQ